MKQFLAISLVVGLVGLTAGLAHAGTQSKSATVNATVSSPTLSITLDKDGSCTAPNAAVITLVQDSSYPEFMIAPNRLDMNADKNWHFIKISATKNWKLEVKGTNLTGGGNTLAISNLRYWYSGTWAGYSQVTTVPMASSITTGWTPNQIALTPAWKSVYTCGSSVVGAKSYMQYQLDRSSAAAGAYTGTITYRVTDSMV